LSQEPEAGGGSFGQQHQGGQSFGPEGKGGFRDKKFITVRHVEIARKLAISETFDPLEEMRHRLEALVMLDDETRRRRKITDADFTKAKEILAVVLSFKNRSEIPNGGFKMVSIPFPQKTAIEIQYAFEEWLDGPTANWLINEAKDRLTPESSEALRTRFEAKVLPWVLKLTVRVSDAIQLDEFDAAAGKITLKRTTQ